MRTKRKHDRADCPDYADHPHGEELREIDRLLEEIPQLVALVHGDLVEQTVPPTLIIVPRELNRRCHPLGSWCPREESAAFGVPLFMLSSV